MNLFVVGLRSFIFFGVLYLISLAPVGAEIVLGVHPYRDVDELRRMFTPLATYLSGRLNEPVVVRVGRSYAEHISTVGSDAVDIAFLGPAPYLQVVDRYGNKPLLSRLQVAGSATYVGHIVVRNDSSIQSLAELRGRSFAFGDPHSTMSSLVPRHVLSEAEIKVGEFEYFMHLHHHEDVALSVLAGDVDAGAVKHEVLEHYASKGLHSLAESPRISTHLFVARVDLPEQKIATIRQAMLDLKDPRILGALRVGTTALVPVRHEDYSNLREILRALNGCVESR